MEVRILGWRYGNIRGGLRDMELDFGNPPNRWTLVQMPNGMGKTTTMQLLRAILSGAQLDEVQVRSLRPSDTVQKGEFELRLLIGGQVYRLFMQLDYANGQVTYATTRSLVRGGGKDLGLHLPTDLQNLITHDFARLFIFDGELARQIRDITKERATEAVKTLYRLDRMDILTVQIDRLIDEEQLRAAATTTAQTAQGLRQLRSRLATAKKKLGELEETAATFQKDLAERSARLRVVDGTISEHMQRDAGFRKEWERLVKEGDELVQELTQVSEVTLNVIRNPVAIHSRILQRVTSLGSEMQQMKLPRTTSLEFFSELAEQIECICGRPIGPEEKAAILRRSAEFLSEDQIGVVNAIKSSVRQLDAIGTSFDTYSARIRDFLRQQQQNIQNRDLLKSKRVESGDVELAQFQKESQLLGQEIDDTNGKLKQLLTKDRNEQAQLDWETNIPLCKDAVADRERALEKATHTAKFAAKARLTKDLVRNITREALASLKERVRAKTNEKLKKFIRDEQIRVARIGGALELESDQLRTKEQVSEGQSLAIAYAFLTSLFEDAPYQLPFVVDSPAVSLDVRVRREVAELVPPLFEQMIMFVISSEREGFAEPFYSRAGSSFLTIWIDQNGDSRISNDLKFFRSFHSDTDNVMDGNRQASDVKSRVVPQEGKS